MSKEKTLGIRCSNSEYAVAIMSGDRKAPQLHLSSERKFPRGYATPEKLVWFHKEISELLIQHEPRYVVVKADESVSKSNSSIERSYVEGIVFLACGERIGKNSCGRKRKSTIAKDLGIKGKAKYLKSFDTSPIPKFDDMSEKERDATLCAWSELRSGS